MTAIITNIKGEAGVSHRVVDPILVKHLYTNTFDKFFKIKTSAVIKHKMDKLSSLVIQRKLNL